MAAEDFWAESTPQSRAKARIVSKYFFAWAKIMLREQGGPRGRQRSEIAYVDLFAGRGLYGDGTKSTPILVLDQAIADPILRNRLVTIFNDADVENVAILRDEIDNVAGIASLKHPPKVESSMVGSDLTSALESVKLVPTLFFVDPWGYKGLSLRLINAAVKHWGCDCIFFFNYNRINPGLTNPLVVEHMNALFGPEEASILRTSLEGRSPHERELAIVEAICEALMEDGKKYVLPFTFSNADGTRTSHHLIFVSKRPEGQTGYKIMKEVMAKESSEKEQGVASFIYNPESERQPVLFGYARPLDELKGSLLDVFQGMRITVGEIVEKHNVGTPYIAKNYKDALKQLELEQFIEADPSHAARRKDTMGDGVIITFPSTTQDIPNGL